MKKVFFKVNRFITKEFQMIMKVERKNIKTNNGKSKTKKK